jgi:uncharacterized protein (TIGR03663 family)
MNRWSALAFVFAVLIGLALRIPNLTARPLHNDEAVNATKVAELWQEGRYKYDHDEYHGPTLHYATAPFLSLSGAKNINDLPDAALRVAPIVFGIGLIFLLLLFHDALDRRAIAWAALFTAISPAMVFYSRYFIHEMLLIFFAALTLGAAWRYTQTPKLLWATLTGVGVGLMFATKETFVLSLAAMGLATLATFGRSTIPRLRQINRVHLAFSIAAAALVWLLFFSSFLANFPGLLDSIRTYFPWLKRAGGHSPHIHPWYFYFQRLAWFHPAKGPVFSEALILVLAAVGAFVSLRNANPLPRFLTFYTLFLAAIYTAISYKTPWCLLNFFHVLILLAGVGAVAIIDRCRWPALKMAVSIAIFLLAAQLTQQAVRASQEYASDRRNPYVYAQTVPSLLELVDRVHAIAAQSPEHFKMPIKVITPDGDYWPLPWYLRRFPQIGWFDAMPSDPYAPIIIVAADLDARLDEKSDKKWISVGYTELRPKKFLELYVEIELWKKYVATLPRATD